MSYQTMQAQSWKERAGALVRAAVVVTCYLIVFAGLLYTVAGGATAQ